MKKNGINAFLLNRRAKKILLTMKLTILLLLFGLMQVSATVYSQATKFNLRLKDRQIVDVLKEIEENSDFRFFYQREQVDVERRVSVKTKNATVEEILDELFSDNEISYKVLEDNLVLLMSFNDDNSKSDFQQKTISGKVTDRSGEPLPGVTVAVKGTTHGTITNSDGTYSFTDVPKDATLLFSYIGMKTQEIFVNGRTVIDVVLETESFDIDEVVAVGYGTMKKSDLTGSVASINEEQMMKRSPLNLAQGLQGSAAGVMVTKNSGSPDGAVTIRVRGVATVNGSAAPLYVVDGIQVGTDANFINPADVESIEILKDASSTAIYGARGANGVILITTKKGHRGDTKLTLTANFGAQNLSRKLNVADAELFAYSVRQGNANDNANIQNMAFGEEYIGKLRTIDWQDAMTGVALQKNYSMSISGGSKNTQSHFSVGYLNNEGIVINSNFKRLTARANLEHSIRELIRVGGSVSFAHSESIGYGNLRSYAELTPTMDYVDELTGKFISNDYKQNDDGTWPTFMQISGNGDIAKGQDNPYAVKMEQDDTPTYNNKVIANAYLDMDILKGLSFKVIGSYMFTANDYSNFSIANTRSIVATGVNSFALSQFQDNNLELESYFTYNLKNDIHNLTLMAGSSQSRYWGHWVSASANDFLSDDYRDISLTSNASSMKGDGGYRLEERFLSFYGRAIYSLKNRYVFTGTVRRDGSSNFGAGNRWGVFPSAALAWRLSEEDFIKSLNIFNNLKLRLGWGQTGNAGGPTNLSIAQLSSDRIAYDWGSLGGSSENYNKNIGVAQLSVIDTNLKWETNTQANVGFDIGLLNSGLNITMDYFIRDSKDLLLYRNIRPSTGYTQVYTNAGHIKNTGFEFSLSYNKKMGDWNIGATLTGSTLKNKVIEVGDPIYSTFAGNGDNWENHSVTMNDYAVGSYYGYIVEDIFRDQASLDAANALAAKNGFEAYQVKATTVGDYKYKDINGDGHIDGEDQTVLGNGFPDLNYGLTFNVSFKNWDAMIYLYGVNGLKINSYSAMKLTNLYKSGGGVQNTLKEFINNSWSENQVDAGYPRMTMVDYNENNRASDVYVMKGDYLKIDNIQIGYTFPIEILRLINMTNARIFVSVENLACFSGYNKYGDPEVGVSNVLRTGFDGGRYPYPRTFRLGLNLNF